MRIDTAALSHEYAWLETWQRHCNDVAGILGGGARSGAGPRALRETSPMILPCTNFTEAEAVHLPLGFSMTAAM